MDQSESGGPTAKSKLFSKEFFKKLTGRSLGAPDVEIIICSLKTPSLSMGATDVETIVFRYMIFKEILEKYSSVVDLYQYNSIVSADEALINPTEWKL